MLTSSNVEIVGRNDENRCLVAANSFEPGATILNLPLENILVSAINGKQDELTELFQFIFVDDSLTENTNHIALMLRLIHATYHPSSHFHEYANILPQSYLNIPMHMLAFAPKRLDCLQGTPLLDNVQEEMERMQSLFQHVILGAAQEFPTHFGQSHPINEEQLWRDVLWAHSSIESRAFKLKLTASGELETALVPLGDMANHSEEPNMETAGVQEGCLVLRARRLIHKGEEITISYRSGLPNWMLLSFYGFAFDNNKHETVTIGVLTEPSEDLLEGESYVGELEVRKELLMSNIEGFSDHFAVGIDGVIPDSAMSSLRLLVANMADLEGVTIDNVSERVLEPLSPSNERRVYESVLSVTQALLASFASTLEEDLIELEICDSWERPLLVYLKGQKEILKELEQRAKTK